MLDTRYHRGMPETPQTYNNHARRDLPFMLAMLVLAVNFCVTTWNAIQTDRIQFVPQTLLWVAVALALLVIGLKARANALKAQDRVIRLEERMRMAALLPGPLLARADGLTIKQIVALRFASDAELPGLVERTLSQKLEPKQIKEAIVTWRPDHDRV